MIRWSRRLVAAAVLALVAGIVPLAGPAAAAETYPVPASGVYTLTGHGFGHGRGMSQWGAQGLASRSYPYTTILGFYYPGTASSTTAGVRALRVWLSRDDEVDTTIYAEAGLHLVWGRQSVALPTTFGGKTVTFYRAYRTTTGTTRVDGRVSGGWFPVTIGGRRDFTGTVVFTDDDRMLRLLFADSTSRTYRGAMQAVPSTGTLLLSVAALTTEEYLRSVVPSESFASWFPAALRAQAVAARTFASKLAVQNAVQKRHPEYDVCDTTACQVFNGTGIFDATGRLVKVVEQPSTDAAVKATVLQVLTFSSALIDAQFSASNGGWTTGVAGFPYLVDKHDPYDGGGDVNGDGKPDNPNWTWTDTLPASSIQAAYPAIGTLASIQITRIAPADHTSRITVLTLIGRSTLGATTSLTFDTSNELDSFRAKVDVDTSVDRIRHLKSTVFTPTP